MNDGRWSALRKIAEERGIEIPPAPITKSDSIFEAPGRYDSSELLDFYHSVDSTYCPELPEISDDRAQQNKLKEISNLIYLHSRQAKCSVISGYETAIEGLLSQQFSDVETTIQNTFDVTIGSVASSSLPELNAPYGLKGGAARMALRKSLGFQEQGQPRDIDLVRCGEADEESDLAMSKLWMPEDFVHSKKGGVEVITSRLHYLRNRDLTMNELFVMDGQIHLTLQCMLDTINNVIRPSSVHFKNHAGAMRGSIAAKSLRLLSEQAASGNHAEILYFGVHNNSDLRPFDIGLHLRRAAQSSPAAARLFLASIALTKSCPGLPWESDPLEVIRFLESRCEFPPGFFRDLTHTF